TGGVSIFVLFVTFCSTPGCIWCHLAFLAGYRISRELAANTANSRGGRSESDEKPHAVSRGKPARCVPRQTRMRATAGDCAPNTRKDAKGGNDRRRLTTACPPKAWRRGGGRRE